ncbi:hypothetical protein BKA93DRAFT_750194 [Sparassis latifolia]
MLSSGTGCLQSLPNIATPFYPPRGCLPRRSECLHSRLIRQNISLRSSEHWFEWQILQTQQCGVASTTDEGSVYNVRRLEVGMIGCFGGRRLASPTSGIPWVASNYSATAHGAFVNTPYGVPASRLAGLHFLPIPLWFCLYDVYWLQSGYSETNASARSLLQRRWDKTSLLSLSDWCGSSVHGFSNNTRRPDRPLSTQRKKAHWPLSHITCARLAKCMAAGYKAGSKQLAEQISNVGRLTPLECPSPPYRWAIQGLIKLLELQESGVDGVCPNLKTYRLLIAAVFRDPLSCAAANIVKIRAEGYSTKSKSRSAYSSALEITVRIDCSRIPEEYKTEIDRLSEKNVKLDKKFEAHNKPGIIGLETAVDGRRGNDREIGVGTMPGTGDVFSFLEWLNEIS